MPFHGQFSPRAPHLRFGLGCVLAAAVLAIVFLRVAIARQSSPSVVEAARQAREQRKNSPPPRFVWTNDNLPNIAHESPAKSPQPPAPAAAPAAPQNSAQPAAAASQNRDATRADLQRARDDLASLETDLDLPTRENRLDRRQFYSNPGYQQDSDGQARLAREAAAISAKHQAVETAKARVAQLEKRLAQSAPSGPAPTTP
jgi:hypothetical protein